MTDEQLSRRLSYLLRHAPGELGVTLEPDGWAPVQAVLRHLRVSREQLERVVATNNKQRFSLDGDRIRANQGHSVPVDLGLTPAVPPARLYHGTHPAALPAIRQEGLRKMGRHHVHLSPDPETARRVGARRGVPVVLEVEAGAMHAAGYVFYLSANGVWLVDAVPPEFLAFP
ncbi:RNA 2'-phosphotransferase [Deinococcus metallilatus]|uniref:Probable RNA 2'-phosphotransferase n=1 Tax=Deinococcus metallilatus TaxID=1211322 RepID=A0AAJ5JX55_9DEIO|nr:RNA 2'-phosphotransferase [Deinococcus metallilatus]MBB5297099.1 putative RNA 2'-phosphotransferase [Deinococcus metallilatus]QBY07791.1 RNA 2'-phosphotransferase [Deinococcus metallilatus]RXJ13491.1 RNA 2'-phosphotransferase [Deinococcus metallilatus]TLK22352.1 RNA 2'-phosphotransferase [Deinococcus metallilatus]GMA17352.1 putative RNA 2'-phosphotransferase [Deinococcus metallilatus]